MEKKSLSHQFINLVGSYKLLFSSLIAICMAGAGVYIYITPSTYESEAVIQYDMKTQANSFSLLNNDENAVTEQIKSARFISEALEKEKNLISYYVTQDYKTRESSYASPYTITYTVLNKNFKEQLLTIHELSDKDYQIISTLYGRSRSKPGKFGEETIYNDLALTITKKNKVPYISPSIYKEPEFSCAIQSPEYLAQNLQNDNQLSVTNNNGVITISCRQQSAPLASQITNALASHFVNATSQVTDAPNETPMTALNQRIELLSNELAATEEQIASYKKQNEITDLNNDNENSLEVLTDLQLQKTELEMNMSSLDNISNYLRKNRDSNNSMIEYGAISDPEFSMQITKLNAYYTANKTSENSSTQDNEIETLKSQIAERILNTRKRTALQLEKINGAIALTKNQLATFPDKANSLIALDRKLVLDKKVYDLLVEKRAQMIVSGNFLTENTQILKPASTNNLPVNTPAWLLLCLGLLTGVSISTIVAALLNMKKQTKISQRVELNQQIGIQFIGNIANEKKNPERCEESFNDLCTRVLLKPETKMITITSSVRGEGKTYIALNFSKAFAAMDKKVLIVDMNPFNPEVADNFEVTPEHSLADVLEGKCDIHDAVSLTSFPNLDVLVSGNLVAGVNSLLSSHKRNDILNDLRKHYDLIIVDTPGTEQQIDAIPMMKISDLNLFVVRANTTRKQAVINAGLIKTDYDISNMNFLLNSVTINKSTSTKGNAYRGRYRKMETPPSAKVNKDVVPSFLRKIALWFY
ncbi:MAG: AAA family ATPase [Bacteroidetes bacterium]|nr:AAA family ATPase [Bacteroidota bacterium]